PQQQTTPDFLTSMTNPVERTGSFDEGCNPPNTPDEFAQAQQSSQQRAQLLDEIDRCTDVHPFYGQHHQKFFKSRRVDQSPVQRKRSPFNLSYWDQLSLTLWRAYVLLKNDPSIPITLLVVSNLFEALIASSVLYSLPENTTSFFRRTLVLFFIVIINAF